MNIPLTPESEPRFFEKLTNGNNRHPLFPACDIHWIPQRSDEWFDLRKGKLTATGFAPWLVAERKVRMTVSEIQALLTATGIGFTKGCKKDDLIAGLPNAEAYATFSQVEIEARNKALDRMVVESADFPRPPRFEVDSDGPAPMNPTSYAIWNGINNEANNVAAFEREYGLDVTDVGFCVSLDAPNCGCSPDGLIMAKGWGFEGKAPIGETHLAYMRDPEKLLDAYRYQVHGSMAVTGASKWILQSFCCQHTVSMVVDRDDLTERLLERMIDLSAEFDTYRERVENEWDDAIKGATTKGNNS